MDTINYYVRDAKQRPVISVAVYNRGDGKFVRSIVKCGKVDLGENPFFKPATPFSKANGRFKAIARINTFLEEDCMPRATNAMPVKDKFLRAECERYGLLNLMGNLMKVELVSTLTEFEYSITPKWRPNV